MLRALSCWPLAVLFLANVLPSNAQSSAARGAEPPERRVEVAAGAPLWVECPLRPEQRADWRLDGAAPPADALPGGEAPAPAPAGAHAGLTARLHVAAARARHAGVYTCAPGGGGARVRVVLLPAPGPTPAEAGSGSAVEVAESAGAGAGGMKLVYFEVRHNITLDCAGLATDAAAPLVWKKNGTAVEQIPELTGRYKLENSRFDIWRRALEDDFGNYSCESGSDTRAWELRARTHAKLTLNTNVVEEQKIKLSCKLIGKPYQGVVWRYSNSSETVELGASVEIATAAEGEVVAGAGAGGEAPRITLRASEQGVAGAELVIAAARLEDAGWYSCTPLGPGATAAVTQLRVKDKYAALWPFLGICAEVFVLCAIILIYERRRTKPELDDSDTDNHDQKKS